MRFPLLRCPGTIAILDDERHYLETLALVLPGEMVCRFYLKPQSFVNRVRSETFAWEQEKLIITGITNSWLQSDQSESLLPKYLSSFFSGERRFDITTTIVVDYAMPAMDGLKVLQELSAWPGKRVLMTGMADERVAVEAFNLGLIDQYIPKQAPDALVRLLAAIARFEEEASRQRGELLRSTLQPEQLQLLSEPALAQALTKLVREQDWVEYIVVGQPFGIIGAKSNGELYWLQLETSQSVKDLAQMLQTAGWSESWVQQVGEGTRLADLELQNSLGHPQRAQLLSSQRLCEAPLVYSAIVKLDETVPAYDAFNERFAARDVIV
jgi:CheY-like chemotaxis protein